MLSGWPVARRRLCSGRVCVGVVFGRVSSLAPIERRLSLAARLETRSEVESIASLGGKVFAGL